MEWKNKGHELDKIGNPLSEKLKGHKKIYIYGAGILGEYAINAIKGLGCFEGFIDKNEIKQRNGYLGYNVLSIEKFMEYSIDENIVIIAASVESTKTIMKKLLILGYKESINCFEYYKFVEIYLPILSVYKYNKSYLKAASMLITEKCTLKCEKCAAMLPYIDIPRNYEFNNIKQNIDLFFEKIDFVHHWVLTGGEPLMHPSLADIVDYIGEKYSNQIGIINIITNGTIMPSSELLNSFQKYKVLVTISDYSKTLFNLEEKLELLENCFNEKNIRYDRLKSDNWVDFGFNYVNKKEATDDEMINFFDACSTPCRGYIDGKIYFCTNAKMAGQALGFEDDLNNSINLLTLEGDYKKDILEFDMGYIDKGYLELCRRCNGHLAVNKNYVETAEQLS